MGLFDILRKRKQTFNYSLRAHFDIPGIPLLNLSLEQTINLSKTTGNCKPLTSELHCYSSDQCTLTGMNEMALSATTKANTHVAFICLHHLLRGSISWSYLGLRKESEPGNRTNKDARLTWRSSSRSKPIQGHFQESRLSSHNTAPPPWTAHFTWLLFHHPISKEVIPQP